MRGIRHALVNTPCRLKERKSPLRPVRRDMNGKEIFGECRWKYIVQPYGLGFDSPNRSKSRCSGRAFHQLTCRQAKLKNNPGECRWNYRFSISWSRVRSPPSQPRCSSVGRAGSFHPGRSLLTKNDHLVAGTCARSSVVEHPPFKRCVVGSIPTGHTKTYPGECPWEYIAMVRSAPKKGFSRTLVPRTRKKKGKPRRMPKELHCSTLPG